ncbi:NADH:ubiquinone reductase (Na(+)-transporting) subunit C [Wenyingzhuangia sp. IMCC45533]
MKKNSNAYTFIFAIVIVTVIAGLLAFTATNLKPLQAANVEAEKMQNILSTIGVDVESRDDAQDNFNKYIKEQLSLTSEGEIDKGTDAFTIGLKNEIKKPVKDQRFPLYIAEKEGKKYYIVPLHGAGLWDAIWGYIALDEDKNTIIGASYDHKGETPGLGAEINTEWFQDQYEGKKILDKSNEFVSVVAIKGGAKEGDEHGVDAISGGTITSNGVTAMIEERLEHYLPYFKNN